MVDYMNARGMCPECGEFMGWADGPPHECVSSRHKSNMYDILREIEVAEQKFPPFASPHEGYAIIKEELDELWEEIRKQYDVRSTLQMRKEAIQIAAMALRFMADLCE